jgi:hypothetical protein
MKPMMSKLEFSSLNPGDLLCWRGLYLRTVISNSHPPDGRTGSVTLTIRRRSWTNRASTAYGYHDIKHNAFPIGKRTKKLCLPSEAHRLAYIGFDLRKEFRHSESASRFVPFRQARGILF